mmetsp:Transcript_17006/g.49141  ORF Transcript_17006/g.49141 Transcript_17006/m.49141 type:complete len:83 (+) Transcript_17006:117-365(+)
MAIFNGDSGGTEVVPPNSHGRALPDTIMPSLRRRFAKCAPRPRPSRLVPMLATAIADSRGADRLAEEEEDEDEEGENAPNDF